MKTGKIKSFFPGKKSKMKKRPTFFYNLPYEIYEKKSSYEVELQTQWPQSANISIGKG